MNKKYLSAIFLYDIIYILKERKRSVIDTIKEFKPYVEKFLDDINIDKDYIRDLNMIDIICDKLKEDWKIAQDQRLGQFIVNYITSEALLFYYEYDKTEQALDRILNNEE